MTTSCSAIYFVYYQSIIVYGAARAADARVGATAGTLPHRGPGVMRQQDLSCCHELDVIMQ